MAQVVNSASSQCILNLTPDLEISCDPDRIQIEILNKKKSIMLESRPVKST